MVASMEGETALNSQIIHWSPCLAVDAHLQPYLFNASNCECHSVVSCWMCRLKLHIELKQLLGKQYQRACAWVWPTLSQTACQFPCHLLQACSLRHRLLPNSSIIFPFHHLALLTVRPHWHHPLQRNLLHSLRTMACWDYSNGSVSCPSAADYLSLLLSHWQAPGKHIQWLQSLLHTTNHALLSNTSEFVSLLPLVVRVIVNKCHVV